MFDKTTSKTLRQVTNLTLAKPKIGDIANCAISAGMDNVDALRFVKEICPGCKTTLACINWYRKKLRERDSQILTSRQVKDRQKAGTQHGDEDVTLQHFLKAYDALEKNAPSGKELREIASMFSKIERHGYVVQPHMIATTFSDGLKRKTSIANRSKQLEALGQSAFCLSDREPSIWT